MSVSGVCRRVGITRQNYYARRQARQRRVVEAELVVALVLEERKVQPRLGARKLHFMLKGVLDQEGVSLGRDRFVEVLRAKDLLLEPKPAEYPCTTNSHHCLPVFTNRIKGLTVSQPNEVWVGDVTYLRTETGFVFLSLLTDKACAGSGGGTALQRFTGDRRVPGGAENGAGGVASRSEAHPSFRSRNPILFA